MSKFRKKPVVIEAIRCKDVLDNTAMVPAWFSEKVGEAIAIRLPTREVKIMTLEGNMIASENDWIIRGVKGEIYPCKPDIFAATYELADSLTPEAKTEPVGWPAGQRIINILETVGGLHQDLDELRDQLDREARQPAPETPEDRQAKIVAWLRSESEAWREKRGRDNPDVAARFDSWLELADAIEQGACRRPTSPEAG